MAVLPEKGTLIVPVGPSGSGKTKFFDDYVTKHPEKFEIVYYDKVREEVLKKISKKEREKLTPEQIDTMCMEAFCEKVSKELDNGEKSVIADAQNLQYMQRAALKKAAANHYPPRNACAVVFKLKKEELEERNAQKEHPMTPEELNRIFGDFENEIERVRAEFVHVYRVNGDGVLIDEEIEH